MADTLVAVLFVAAAGAAGLTVLALVTVAPFVRAVTAAQSRGGSPVRAGAAAAAGCGLALGLALAAARTTGAALGLVLLLLAWAVPVVAQRGPRRWLGRGARHT